MAHYSSRYIYYEDEGKISLKSISMKRLVFASYAQFGVNAGFEVIVGARNGIRQTTHYPWRPIICDKPIRFILMDLLRGRLGTCIVAKVMYSVACLE